jgi:hypothetical protein
VSDPSLGENVALAARERLVLRFGQPTDLDDPDVMREAWRD